MLGQLRKLHPVTHVALLAMLILFVWLNLDYTRNAYNEQQNAAWCGGMRCGFPMTCWDAGQASLAGVVKGNLNLRIFTYGGVHWLGLAVNVLLFTMAMLGLAWCVEVLRARITVAKQILPRTYQRLHGASYAAALGMAALLLWVNAQHEIQQIQRAGKTDYTQTYGWPLDFYYAHEPAPGVYRSAAERSLEMVAYLEANPNSWFTKAHWNTQNVTLNLMACVALIVLTAFACERIMAWRRNVRAATVSQ